MLKKLAKQGGVVQVCLVSAFLHDMPQIPQFDADVKALQEKYKDYEQLPKETQAKVRQEWRALVARYPERFSNVSKV